MLCLSVIAAAIFRPIHFPEAPIDREMLRGEQVFLQHSGIDRTYQEDRVSIGVWFDGHRNRDVEQAIWLSPSLASRYLGYMRAKEKWTPAEVDRRWTALRRDLNGSVTLLVQLASFEKLDTLDFGDSPPGERANVADVRFVIAAHRTEKWGATSRLESTRYEAKFGPPIAADGKSTLDGEYALQPRVDLLRIVESYDWQDLADLRWSQFVPFATDFNDSLSPADPYHADLGDNYEAFYLVRLANPAALAGSSSFDIDIVSPKKERTASFPLVGLR